MPNSYQTVVLMHCVLTSNGSFPKKKTSNGSDLGRVRGKWYEPRRATVRSAVADSKGCGLLFIYIKTVLVLARSRTAVVSELFGWEIHRPSLIPLLVYVDKYTVFGGVTIRCLARASVLDAFRNKWHDAGKN